MCSSAKMSLRTLPFLVHWLNWPCLWVLIVSFWGLKVARWALDVLKRQIVKPVCDWQITSLAFLWLAKTLNKLSMCSTARWIVHWLYCWIWIALKNAAQKVCSWVRISVCVHSVRCCLYSQNSRPGVLLTDRIGADQRSLTEQLTWGETLLTVGRPFLFLSFYSFALFLSLSLSLTPVSLTHTEIPLSYCTQLSLSPFLFQFSFPNPICLFLYHALCKDTLWEGSI